MRTLISELPDAAVKAILAKYLTTLNYRNRRYHGAKVPFTRAQLVKLRLLAEERQLEWRCGAERLYSTYDFDDRWLSSCVTDLITNKAPLPIISDALMDAGCDDEQLVKHCQENFIHVWNCWARMMLEHEVTRLSFCWEGQTLRDIGDQHLLNIVVGGFAHNSTLMREVQRRKLTQFYEEQLAARQQRENELRYGARYGDEDEWNN